MHSCHGWLHQASICTLDWYLRINCLELASGEFHLIPAATEDILILLKTIIFFEVLGFEVRAYTLSHSTGCFL
jgi:hypothetical protein